MRRALRRTAEGLGLAVVFTGAAATGVVSSLDLPPARRYVTSVTNRVLGSTFEGAIAVTDLRELSVGRSTRVRAGEIVITDPEGKRVLVAHDADVVLDLPKLVRSLRAGGPPDVALARVTASAIEVNLDANAKGELGIARAFAPKKGPEPAVPPPPPPPPDPNAESIRLAVDHLRVGKVVVRGNVAPPGLDAGADDVRAHATIDKNTLAIALEHATATFRAPLPNVNGPIRGEAKGAFSLHLGTSKLRANGEIDGDANGVRFAAKGGIDDGVIDANVDVPRTDAAAIVKLVPVAPLAQPVALRIAAKGKPADLGLDMKADVGDGTVTAKGTLGLEGKLPFRIDVSTTKLDVAAFGGPKSDIAADVHAEGTLSNQNPSGPAGTFRVMTKPSKVDGEALPILVIDGTMKGDAIHADVRADDPGLVANGTADVDLAKKKVDFDVRARAAQLASVGRARGVVSGAATAHGKGTVDYGRDRIDARVTADLSGVKKEGVAIREVHVEAKLDGKMTAPDIDVSAKATDVRLTQGDKQPLVYPTAVAHARVAVAPSPRVLGAEVVLEGKDGSKVTARANEIAFANGVAVRGASVSGLGAPVEVHAEVNGARMVIRAKGERLDLDKAATLTGIEQLTLLPKGTRASVDVDLVSDARRADGHVDVVVTTPDGLGGEVHAKLEGKHVDLRAKVDAGSLGWVEVSEASLDLPGPPSARTLPKATGVIEMRGAIDLGQGAAMFAGDAAERLEHVEGIATFEARGERGDPDRMPAVRATVKTRGLDVALADPEHKAASQRFAGVDLEAHVAYDAATEDAEIGLLGWDKRGALVSANAKSHVPLVHWLKTGAKIDVAALTSLELAGALDVARRDLSGLPAWIGPRDVRGEVAGHVDITGTLRAPVVAARVEGHGITAATDERNRGGKLAPIDLGLDARWDGDNAVVVLQADERGKERREKKRGKVRMLAIGRVRARDLVDGNTPAWDASAELDVSDLELGPLPLPADLRGALSTRVGLRNVATRPHLALDAKVHELTVGGVRVSDGEAHVRARDGSLLARVGLTQEDGGTAQVKLVSKGLHWRGIDVDLDRSKDSQVEYTVNGLSLAMLQPLVRRAVPQLEGRVDGKGSATITESSQTFEGGITLSGGRVYLVAIGEEVSGLGGTLRFDRSGAFRLDDFKGKVGAGAVNASASGKMRGLAFDSVQSVIVIPDAGGGIPLSSEGATFANASGELRIAAIMRPQDDRLVVSVEIPRAPISLPDRNTQSLQNLDDDKTIKVGVRAKTGALVPVRRGRRQQAKEETKPGAKTTTTEVAVNLGKDVSVKGRGMQVYLGGKVVVLMAEELAVRGQIDLRSGSVSVQGRRFVIDQGSVVFNENDQPDNPIIIASAHWDAPDRTRIFVEFSGPLKTGKIVLRSEPAYSKSEILSILLFGRPDPNVGASSGNALGAGLGASGLNQALGELDEDLGVESDTTGANRNRTKLRYQLRRNLSVNIAYAGAPSARELDETYLSFDWVFIPQFSLVGTRGNTGTSILDLIFEHRY